MPKKKARRSSPKKIGLLQDFFEKSADIIVASLSRFDLVGFIKDAILMKETIKSHLIFSIIVIVSSVVFLLGMCTFIASKVPALGNGIIEMILGLTLGLVSVIVYTTGR